MRKLLLSILVSLLTFPTFAGVQLPAKCEAGLPNLLNKKTIKESEVNALVRSRKWGQDNLAKKYWTVYSDRSHNTTYNSPSTSSSKYDELDFNEQVRIAKIEGDFALVFTENQKGTLFPLISGNAKSRGWIPMNNLLLWNSCPTDEMCFYNKGFAILNLEDVGDLKNDAIRCYNNPVTMESPRSLDGGNTIYYVMKKADNDMVLLAKENKIEGYSYGVLYGWVHSDSYIQWKGRVCLEPNRSLSETNELTDINIPIYLGERKIADVGITRYKLAPEGFRYPLLGDNPNNKNQYSIIYFMRSHGIHNDSMTKAYYGYTDKRDENTGLDFWKPVMLFSSDELAQLMEKLQPVMSTANRGNRKPYVDAIKELTRSMIPDITPTEMDEKDVKEIMALVAGLNVKPESLSGRTLIQIQDENVVKQEEFDGMITDFQNKFRKLKKIRDNKYDFSFERNKTMWYWIPVEDLP